ncbi:MAG: 4Fe-4S cluster-binding domain-containing protein [Anaerolineae bacterium]|mgnify:CR=1 FL=1|jgi:uncharacterized protein|nr:4Fe-4S cluster-binding domain-containing protein [Anaerolineae bacterium]MBT7190848.1 4Fe-4S cluster-binding domain-containing protein [Anaerolineae bacterium]MBT7990787.1 4Fe-4S cluster-binding domain-containing protein [Anaerolineae bacterium]
MEPIRKTVALTITQDCNLACTYCYEDYKSKRKMSFDTAVSIVEKYLNDPTDDYDECEIDFFGGEPFLNFPLMKKICEYVWERCWIKPYVFSTSTNGTLVHGEIQDWLYKHRDRFYASLSLDGTEEMHDQNRSKSFSNIDIPFFVKTWAEPSIKMTISAETLPSLSKGVIYLHSFDFEIHNNLAYGIDWTNSKNTEILSRELHKLIKYYLGHPNIKPCSLLDMQIQYRGYDKKKWCGVGTDMVAFDVDGKNYPCHGFLPISVGQNEAEISRSFDFSVIDDLIDPKCKDCILYNICPTCYGANYGETSRVEIRNQQLCNLTKTRALACSYFEAQRILTKTHASGIKEKNLSIIEAILEIQKQFSV